MTANPATGRAAPIVRFGVRRSTVVAVLGCLLVLAAPLLYERWWEHQHQGLYGRYKQQYGSGCLAGSFWGIPPAPGQVTGTAADGLVGARIPLEGPVRLEVVGHGGRSLTFAARERLGTGALEPVDDVTRQVLAEHRCSR